MQQIAFQAMGCHMQAVIDADTDAAAAEAARVPGWFEKWELCLSRFRPDSDLAFLNGQAGHMSYVGDVLWSVLQIALGAALWTDGLVTPTLLDALAAAGYDRSIEDLPPSTPAVPRTAVLAPGAWREIQTEPVRRRVRLPAGVHIDLGGIAKGWAAEQAAGRLSECGPSLVDAGGDIVVSGPMADGSGWPVDVADPLAPDRVVARLVVDFGTIATSGRDYRRWQRGGVWQHHILDPRTARPATTDVVAVTIVAPLAWQAEAAAKTALILGSRAGLAWLEARRALGGLLVLDDGRVVHSYGMQRYLWS